MLRMGRSLKWIIGGVVALVVVAVGGAWIYAAIDEAPGKLALTTTTAGNANDTTTTGAASASGDIAGTWKPTAASLVGYRVKETLNGVANEAYGRTSEVQGSMTVAGTTIQTVDLTVDMTSISSDRTQRDGQFRGRIMETSQFPTATFSLTRPLDVTPIPAEGTQLSAKATGKLTLHGVTKTVTFDLKAQRLGSTIEAAGQIPITFADYNISDPSGGPARTEDHGILEFKIIFEKSA
jgi:polyisoprenoid-binding protein YceI